MSILPGILWVWFFYRKDKYNPEPKILIVRAFIFGMLVVIPAGIIESPFARFLTTETPLLQLFLATILVVGIVEEGLKSYVVYRLHYEHEEFDEAIDGIIYGVSVGLGFGAFENLFYTILFGYQVGLIRAVLTNLAHAAFTGIFGYYLGQAKITGDKKLMVYGFLLVSFLHGIYNFLVISEIMGIVNTMLAVLLLQIYLASLIKEAIVKPPFK